MPLLHEKKLRTDGTWHSYVDINSSVCYIGYKPTVVTYCYHGNSFLCLEEEERTGQVLDRGQNVFFKRRQCSRAKCTVSRWASPRHYTVYLMLLPSGNPCKCHEEDLYLQPMIPPKRFDIFPLDWGMLRMSRRVLIFLLNNKIFLY